MVSVIISTTNRPRMLRTALQSIQRQTARDQIAEVIVSENAGKRDSEALCAEFPDLPLKYIFRDPVLLPPPEHGRALYAHPDELAGTHVAILHDDDWWGPHHIEDGVAALEKNPDAASYWSTSFLVHGESSWYMQCWNESCWISAGFPPLTDVVRLDRKQATLACVGSGPAHYSTLIAEKNSLAEAFSVVADTGNLHDNDRLLFLELSRRGILLVSLVPDVFVRQHPAQDQRQLSLKESYEHIAAATQIVLKDCAEQGIDLQEEFIKLYRACPVKRYRPYLMGTFDPRVMKELERCDAVPLPKELRRRDSAPKWLFYQVCPPALWFAAKRLKTALLGSPAVEI